MGSSIRQFDPWDRQYLADALARSVAAEGTRVKGPAKGPAVLAMPTARLPRTDGTSTDAYLGQSLVNALSDYAPVIGDVKGAVRGGQEAAEGHPVRGLAALLASLVPVAPEGSLERAITAAYKSKGGQLFTGPIHVLAHQAARDAGALGDHLPDGVDGFMTNTGRFVDRGEAASLARQADPSYPRAEYDALDMPGVREWRDAKWVEDSRKAAVTGDSLASALLRVYHATSPENADRLLAEGFTPGNKRPKPPTIVDNETVAKMLGVKVGDPLPFEPGRGMGSGLYVAPTPNNLSHYGSDVLEVQIPQDALRVPPERAASGRLTPSRALELNDGYTEQAIPASAFRRITRNR